jgi:2-iminobutanoate/2-iminopropanoate deaminase
MNEEYWAANHRKKEASTMAKRIIRTEEAPKPIGPYSQATVANGFVYAAGQAGVDPATGKLVAGGVAAQTRQTFENIGSILEAAGCSLADVVSNTVYLADLGDFSAMNQVYAGLFPDNPPARTTVGVASLPMGAAVEITAVAALRGE